MDDGYISQFQGFGCASDFPESGVGSRNQPGVLLTSLQGIGGRASDSLAIIWVRRRPSPGRELTSRWPDRPYR